MSINVRLCIITGIIAFLSICWGVTGQVVVTLPATPIGGEVGYFYVESVPSNADVYFDGSYAGETPVSIAVHSTATPSHTISVSAPGYETWTRSYSYNPGPGQTVYVTGNLVPTQQFGSVYVSSSPQSATATLDRSFSQTTPCTFTDVAAGSHEITVSKPGFQTYYSTITVKAGKSTDVSAYLTPLQTTGNLAIYSSPGGASAYVDGIYYGATPTTVGNLVPGSHNVQIRLPGYQDWTGYASVQAGLTTTINPTLVKNPPVSSTGSVSVTSTPSGALVYLDGAYQGKTPPGAYLNIYTVTTGSHVILLSRTGYQDYTGEVQVSAAQNTRLSITLTPNPQPTKGSISITSSPSGAEAFVDNIYRGITPLMVDNLDAGSHVVLLKLGGHSDWQSTVQVAAGQVNQISATMAPGPTPTPTQTGSLPYAVLAALSVLALFAVSRR